MVNLFISLYNETNSKRAKELYTCLMNNFKSGCFDAIWIIAESDNGNYDYLPDVSPYSFNLLPCTVRPTFETFFNAINTVTGVEDINVIANSDIYFVDLPVLPAYNQCFALTRYEVDANGGIRFLNRRDSQDSYVFFGHIKKPSYAAFYSLPGCDNRICWELRNAGYQILNPSLTIKTFHLHNGEKSYDGTRKVNTPYLFLEPVNI